MILLVTNIRILQNNENWNIYFLIWFVAVNYSSKNYPSKKGCFNFLHYATVIIAIIIRTWAWIAPFFGLFHQLVVSLNVKVIEIMVCINLRSIITRRIVRWTENIVIENLLYLLFQKSHVLCPQFLVLFSQSAGIRPSCLETCNCNFSSLFSLSLK